LAGYSWLEADKLRKAMGKKIPAEMQAQKWLEQWYQEWQTW
jgi:DNA polymerase III alpha subunit